MTQYLTTFVQLTNQLTDLAEEILHADKTLSEYGNRLSPKGIYGDIERRTKWVLEEAGYTVETYEAELALRTSPEHARQFCQQIYVTREVPR